MALVSIIAVYLFVSAKDDLEKLERTSRYLSGMLVLTSAASFGAVGVSLSTYALDPQFFTGGAYYVKVGIKLMGAL